MQMRKRTMAVRTVLVFFFLLTLAHTATAQPREERLTPRRMPVAVVLVDTLPHDPGAAYEVQRRPGFTPHDVILLRTTATVEDLANAVWLVIAGRTAGGDLPAREMALRSRPHPVRGGTRRAVLPWVRRVLDDLQRAEPHEVAGLGKVRAVEIWLPRQGTGTRLRP